MDLDHLQQMAHELQPFVASLTSGPRYVEELPLLDRPVQWQGIVDRWERRFGSAREASRGIAETLGEVLNHLWESQGAWCCARVYETVETWLRSHTLTVHHYRPLLTTKSIWMIVAAHNWLWWYRNPDRVIPLEANMSDTARGLSEQTLSRDVDAPLERLHSEVSEDEPVRCELGDLVAMHLIAENLGRLFRDLGRDLTRAQKSRLEKLLTTCALSRLVAVCGKANGQEKTHQPRTLDDSWIGIETLLTQEEAAGLRQYLSSHFGRYAMLGDRQAAEVLDTFDALSALSDREGAPAALRDGVRTFVAQVLRATCSESTDDAAWKEVWNQWCFGFPDRTSLAQWCGRLAQWCEARARTHHGRMPPEQEWLWRELAQSTLPRWLRGREEAILCWGLWLLGYLENPGHTPRLVLARNACGQSLEQLVSSWSTAVGREERRASYQGEHLKGQGRIDQLTKALKSNSVFKSLLPDEVLGHALWERVDEPRGEPKEKKPNGPPTNPGVKAYRY